MIWWKQKIYLVLHTSTSLLLNTRSIKLRKKVIWRHLNANANPHIRTLFRLNIWFEPFVLVKWSELSLLWPKTLIQDLFLLGEYFFELDDKSVLPGYPKLIQDVWGMSGPIDAAFTRINCQGKSYIFKVGASISLGTLSAFIEIGGVVWLLFTWEPKQFLRRVQLVRLMVYKMAVWICKQEQKKELNLTLMCRGCIYLQCMYACMLLNHYWINSLTEYFLYLKQ